MPGGSDCFSLSAFSLSWITSVYRYLLHRTLNLTLSFVFFILTAVNQNDISGIDQLDYNVIKPLV